MEQPQPSTEIQQAVRTARAMEIARHKRITKKGLVWIVPSQTHTGSYVVAQEGETPHWNCTCPDYELRKQPCKHVISVELVRFRSVTKDGVETSVETMKVTYGQNWPAYNAAQVNEKKHFEVLLRDLVRGVPQPPQSMGRPRLPLRDVIFAAASKVYSTQSGRRASTDIRACLDKGFIEKAPSYNSIFRYLGNPEMTKMLKALIVTSAGPLTAIETDFAIDSTGIGTSSYERWHDYKYGSDKARERSQHVWVKLHAMCGVKTNVIVGVESTPGNVSDPTQLPSLVDQAVKGGFKMVEVSADKAYLSHNNVAHITANGATPYIPFKTGTGEGVDAPELWKKLFHYFTWNREGFLRRYSKRSNIESCFHMIKSKFGPAIRSKTPTAQINEVLLKVLAHNVVVLVGAMYELGIDPTFGDKETLEQQAGGYR